MITPDRGGPESDRSISGRAGLVGLAAVTVLGGIIALGLLMSPDPGPETADTTTTTTIDDEIEAPIDDNDFTISQIARGEQFEFTSALVVEDGYPLALVDYKEDLYVFSTNAPDFSGMRPGGIRAWRSSDGAEWESLGQVIPEDRIISAVSATGQGLVALEPGAPGAGFTVWRSADGVAWDPEEVIIDGSSDLIVIRPVSTGGTDGLLVVSGAEQLHVADLIEERLGEHYSDAIEMGPYGWSTEITFQDEIIFTLYGPVGLPLASVTGEDLELTDEERDLIEDVYRDGDRRSIWIETDLGWTVTEIPNADTIQWIGTTPDGRIIATGYGSRGLNAWATRDGSTWESLPSFPGPYHIDNWGNRVVGPSNNRTASILVSNREGGWDELGPAAYFPDTLDWSIGDLGAGPPGVAAIVNGWGDLPGERVTAPPPTLADDAATLTLYFRSGEYTLTTEDGETYTWSMGGDPSGGIQADLMAGTISFHEPETGESLATFAFEEINQAANTYWSDQGSRENIQAFTFTDDSGAWTIQNPTDLGDVELGLVEVTRTHVVLAGIAEDFNPTTSPGFEVWSAEIP